MSRQLRINNGNMIYHVVNRGNYQQTIFFNKWDYAAFLQIIKKAMQRIPVRILAYCLMPNHWHLVVWPGADGDLSKFVGLITHMHARNWNAFRGKAGTGHLYQGRFKSVITADDDHFLEPAVVKNSPQHSYRVQIYQEHGVAPFRRSPSDG